MKAKSHHPAWADHIDALIRLAEQNAPVQCILDHYSAIGAIVPAALAVVKRILDKRRLMWLDFNCRPPVGCSGPPDGTKEAYPAKGWIVPTEHPRFNPDIHIPRILPKWVRPADWGPEVDFSCD